VFEETNATIFERDMWPRRRRLSGNGCSSSAQRQAKETSLEEARVTQNEASREWWATLKAQCRKGSLTIRAAMLHRQMREERLSRKAMEQAAKGMNDGRMACRAPQLVTSRLDFN
jgi:hypothetical protein